MAEPTFTLPDGQSVTEDIADVRGQHHAKRALEVAAAGGHSLLMVGPPDTGKTMLASRLPGILPQLNEDEALETAAFASISDHGFDTNRWQQPLLTCPTSPIFGRIISLKPLDIAAWIECLSELRILIDLSSHSLLKLSNVNGVLLW